jgi:peptidoglycan hydrolase CwlO-like protein
MAKEKLVTIHVHTPFTLTLGDQSKQEFGRGRHNVPEEVASHWFTQAHSELSESVISDTDDLQPIIDSLQAQIADKDKQIVDKDQLIVDKDQLIADLKEALLKLQEQNDSLQAQIAAAQTGGNGAKDAKESKPANSK